MQPYMINFLTSHGYAVIVPSSIGEKGSSDEVLGAILPNSDAQTNGVSLEDVAKRYLNFMVASFTYLTNDFFGTAVSRSNINTEYTPGESVLDTARRITERECIRYTTEWTLKMHPYWASRWKCHSSLQWQHLKSRNQSNLKVSFYSHQR